MFSQTPRTNVARAKLLSLAAAVGLLAAGGASAQASVGSPPSAGDAVIASANGTTIDTTSGTTGLATERRTTSASSSGAITLNSSGPTVASPTKATAAKSASASQVDANVEPIVAVGSSGPRPAESRATVTQLQSGGPIVALSGSRAAPTARHHVAPSAASGSVGRSSRSYRQSAPVSTTIVVNAPGVHFQISPTTTRRPSSGDTRQTAPGHAAEQVGIPGNALAGLLPLDPRPVPAPGGPANTTLFGSASGSAGGSALLGIDALFTVAVLLAGAAWRRRSWDLPVLPGQSALLSLALDRPG
jgi:hypothetical protein